MLAQRHVTGITGESWLAAMRRSDFSAAWAISDAVLAARNPADRDNPARPYHERWVWDGRALAGRQVLVRCYHGLGDTIQFARFIPALRRVAARVVVEAPAALLGLLAAVPGIDALHAFDPARPLPSDEADVEIMELAHALRAVPDPAPYLSATATWRGGVGLCWQASGWAPERNAPPEALLPLVRTQGVRAISLQRGADGAGLLGVVDPLDGSMDLVRLAGLVAGLDAVVTIDTMVAHLAAALGRPTFVILPHEPDWRWPKAGRSAWYRTASCHVQPSAGDWAGAVRAVLPGLDAALGGTLRNGTGSFIREPAR